MIISISKCGYKCGYGTQNQLIFGSKFGRLRAIIKYRNDEAYKSAALNIIRKWIDAPLRRNEKLQILLAKVLIPIVIIAANISPSNSAEEYYGQLNEPISPIPPQISINKSKAKLGERLFNDSILSNQNKLSCSSCHNPKLGGISHIKFALDTNNRPLEVNTPTILNSVFNRWQNWNGRITSFEEQIDESVTSPTLMNSAWDSVIKKLKQSNSYVIEFSNEYEDVIKPKYIKDALISYMKTLTTPNSRFDQYLLGDNNAITDEEKAGYEEFKSHGCISCHQGINIGGNVFEKFGIFGNYFEDNGKVNEYDKGRYNVTGRKRDLYVFRVPGLRNIEHTPPYFHDGSAETLEEAVKIMARYQLGSSPSDREVNLMVKFLLTLTGEYKGN